MHGLIFLVLVDVSSMAIAHLIFAALSKRVVSGSGLEAR
jgi:hypothetical protein